jgi:hypothetical protein
MLVERADKDVGVAGWKACSTLAGAPPFRPCYASLKHGRLRDDKNRSSVPPSRPASATPGEFTQWPAAARSTLAS